MWNTFLKSLFSLTRWSKRSKFARDLRRPLYRKDRRRLRSKLGMEELERRDVPTGGLTLNNNVLTLADAGSPTITVSLTSNNYTITDSTGISGTISGWTISGNTATETDGNAASITQLAFITTGATFGTSVTGIAAGPGTAVSITDAGSVTIGGNITGTTGNLSISAAGGIADNANISTTSGTITIAADTAGTGTPGSADFTQAISGATITTTNNTASALTITVNTAGSGTSNANIRTIADSGTLAVNSNGGSILYSGTDNYSSGITSITEANGSGIATVTPAGTTGAPGVTGFYAGEQVTISGTGGVYDGTYTVQSINWSSTAQTAAPSFTINTGSATGLGTVTTGAVASPNGVLEAQALGVVGSDNLGTGPTGEVGALNYSLTATGSGSIGTASRPIQASALASNTVSLSGGSGGDYFVEWTNPLTLNGATATGAGNVYVVAANAGGHNLTLPATATVSTGSGNIILAADDNLVITAGATIGGAGFSGTVYMACNRDQGNTGTLTEDGTITTSNTSVYNNTGNPLTSTPGAVLLEDYSATGTASGALTMATINVGTGGSITATTIPNLGIYDAPVTAGAADIVMNSTSNVLTAGTVNLIDQTGRSSSATAGIGTSGTPIKVAAANVNVTNTGSTTTAEASNFVTDSVAGNFSAVVTGNTGGTIGLTDTATSGTGLTISGLTSTGGGAITLTDTASNIAIDSQLGATGSGAITITGTGHTVSFAGAEAVYNTITASGTGAAVIASGSTVTLRGGTITDSNGITVNAGGTLSGTGTLGASTNLTVNGTVTPSVSAALNTKNVTISGGTMQVTLDSTSQFSQINATGTVTLSSSPTLNVSVGGTLSVGQTFNIIAASGTVTGTFGSVTLPNGYTGSLAYASGTGVTLTITAVPTSDYFDVTGTTGTLTASPGVNNNISMTDVAGVYTLTDSGEPIILTTGATNAGWTGSGTNTVVSTNTANITSFVFNTLDGSDAFGALAAGSANISITGLSGDSVAVNGAMTTTGNVSISTASITDGGAGDTITANTVTLTPSGGLGTSTNPLLTDAASVVATAGTSDVFIQQTVGSVNFTATATASVNLNLSDVDPNGTLTVAGATSTVAGNITISAAGAIADNANINAGSGTIAINADTAGSGSNGFTQSVGTSIATTNTSASGVTITANTSAGGTGNVNINSVTVGSSTAGTLTVTSYGGSILNNSGDVLTASQIGTINGGSAPAHVLTAANYTLSSTGGSVGTTLVPIETTNTGADTVSGGSNFSLSGVSGVYLTDWGTIDVTVNQALATGASNIRVVAANAGGHNLWVNGPVNTGSGTIQLDADDDLILTGNAVVGGTYNSQIFSGTVSLAGNRDAGNGQFVDMAAGSSILTTNASASAVSITDASSETGSDTATATDIAGGGIELANISTGSGGTITVDTTVSTSTTNQGSIVQRAGTLLDVGGTGTLILRAKTSDTSGDGNATAGYVQGGIGVGGTTTSPSFLPITTNAATVIATTTGTSLANSGIIDIVGNDSASFTATTTGNATGTISLTDTAASGTGLTISGPTSTGGGAITLTDTTSNIAIASLLGSSTTGAITVNSGTNNVYFTSPQAGFFTNDPVSVTSANAAEFQSGSSLTFNAGTAIGDANGVQIDQGATAQWGGNVTTGTLSPVTVNGTFAPAGTTTGALTLTGSLDLSSTASLGVNVNTSTAYSSISVSGTATVNAGTTLNVNILSNSLSLGDSLTILTASNGVTWTGAPTSITVGSGPYAYTFSVAVNANTIVLTVTAAPVVTNLDVTNGVLTFAAAGGAADTVNVSIVNTAYTNNQNYYLITDPAEPIVLSQNAINAGWTLTDQNGNGNTQYDAVGPVSGITSFAINTAGGADVVSGIAAGSASVSLSGTSSLSVTGPITTAGNVAFSYPTVDFESNVTTTGNIAFSGVSTITDGAATPSTPGTLTGNAITLAASVGIGSSSGPLLIDAMTATVNSGSADSFVQQQSGSVSVSATATGGTNINLSDIDPNGTLTIGAATSSANGAINVTAAGNIATSAAITSTGGTISLTATGNVTTGAAITAPTTTITAGGNLTTNSTIASPTLTIGAGDNVTIGASISSTNLVTIAAGTTNATAALNDNGAITSPNINLNDSGSSGTLTIGTALTETGSTITLDAAGAIADNANINAGTGTITINADMAGTGTAGTADFTESSPGVTLTSTNASSAITITVNTSFGGTANANIRTINATSGTLSVTTYGGSILYSGSDILDAEQSANYTLAPGSTGNPAITGPAPSGGAPLGSSGAAPTAGTVNALNYVFSTSGSGSIGTATRPINTSSPTNNTESLNAGSGGIYFVDWGNPMTLQGASATGGNLEVVAANAGGHNLTVAGSVTNLGSGEIVLAADDNLVINSGVTIGEASGSASFTGDVYLAANRDTGNTETLTDAGTIATSNTSANAVVIEGFHAPISGDTDAGVVSVGNVTTGNGVGGGGTITISTVPYDMTLNSLAGQGDIVAQNATTVLNAGATGTVNFIATSMAGLSGTAAVGSSSIPMTVTAGTVEVTANVGTGGGATAYGDAVFVTDTIGGNFAATTGTTSPSGSINLSTTSGVLTVTGATSTGNSAAVNLTSTSAGGGIVVSAPLGSTTTGAIALNAGTNAVQITSPQTLTSSDHVTVTAGSATEITSSGAVALNTGAVLNSPSGIQVDSGGSLSGTGMVNTGSDPLNVDGTLAPTVATAGLITHSLALESDGTMQVTINGGGAGQFSEVYVTGTVSLNSSTLVIDVNGGFAVGSTFEIINNDGTDPVTGTFINGGSLTAANLTGYAFSVNYVGGDGNDVVLTVTAVPATDLFDVTSGVGSFFSAPTVNNNLSVTQSGSNTDITDTSDSITLTSNAIAAGWAYQGSTPTNTVYGPTASLTSLMLNTADGSDSINALTTSVPVSLVGTGSLAIGGAVTTTGTLTVSGYPTITDAGVADTLTGSTLNITGPSIGTAANPVYSASPTVTVSTSGNAFVTQATGSVSFTGTGTGAGNLYLGDIDPTGTLTVAGATSTATGNIAISAAGALADNANINAGSGTITISANTAGSGSAGYTQATAATLTTTNTTANALTININTVNGGTGTADVGNALVGNSAGGFYNVNANGGDIMWNETTGQARGTSGVPTNVINAYGFSFNDTGSGGVGDIGVPMQITGPIENDPFSASVGSGGIQVIDFGTEDLQVNQAIATGTGAINIETNNANGHDLLINGTVTTGSGSITLYADDDLVLNGVGAAPYDNPTTGTVGTQVNALIGGAGFSGTVDIESNLDTASADPVIMDAGSAIDTTNTSPNAVLIDSYSAAGGIGSQNMQAGGVQLGNITVGAGGTITVNAAAGTATARQGDIIQLQGTLLDTSGGSGTVYGTIVLTALGDDTNGDGNTSAAAATGDIGVAGSVNNPALLPILVKAATVIASTTGTNLANSGDIDISDEVAGTFTATTSGNATGYIILNTTNGAQLTIGGPTSTAGGTIALNGSGGVGLSAQLGSSTAGAIAINGPLSGSGNIQLGTGGLSVTESTNSSYSGAISGGTADSITYAGPGNLILTNTSSYTGATAVTGGTLTVNGSLTSTSGVTVSGTGVLAGSGTLNASVTDSGVVSPGGGAGNTALLTVGGLTVGTGGAFTADLDGTSPGTGYDQLDATGTGAFSLGGTLNVFVTPGASLAVNNTFTILNDTNGFSGTFANAANGASLVAANNPNDVFTVSYTSTSVVLTLSKVYTSAELDVINGNEVVYTTPSGLSSVLTVSTSGGLFNVIDTGTASNGGITLGSGALALGWSGNGTDMVSGTTIGMSTFVANLNDASDSIAAFNDGSANTTITGTGSLTVSGAIATTGSLAIDDFSSVTNNAAVTSTSGLTIYSAGTLTLNGTGSFASSGGNEVIESNLSIGGDGNTLTFSAPDAGTVTFNANGTAMTLGTETVAQGALVVTNAGALTLNGVLTDGSSSITVNNVTTIAVGPGENLVTPTLNLAASNSIGTSASNVVSSAATVLASSGPGGIDMTQDGSASYTVSTTLGGAINLTDPNASDTLTIAGATTTFGGNISLSAAGAVTDSGNINSGFGTIAISANTAGSSGAGFTQTSGSILSANWTAQAIAITVNSASGGTGNASIDNIGVDNGTLAVSTFGGSIVYGGTGALTSYQLGVSGDGGSAPSQVIAAEHYVFTTSNTNNAAGEIGDPSRPLQLNEPNGATLTATAGSGGVAVVSWGEAGSVTFDLLNATATGAGNVLVVAANASGHNLTVEGNVTTGSGNIELAADDSFTVNSGVMIGGSGFSGTVDMAGNRDQGNTGTLTEGGTILTSNTSDYNLATLTPGAVLLEDYSASGTASGDLALNGNITVGNGGSITATTIPTLGVYDPAVNAGANDIVSATGVVLTAPGGTVNLIASAGRSTSAVGGIGALGSPILVSAANVVATSINGTTVGNASIYVTDEVAGTFTATTSSAVAGSINLTDTSGTLTIGGTTNTTNSAGFGGAITLTSTAAGGGIIVSAPLGSPGSGTIALNAGTNSVLFNSSSQNFYANDPVTITAGTPAEIQSPVAVTLNSGSWSSASGTQVDNGATLGGTGTVVSAVTVQSGGDLDPGAPVGTLSANSVSLGSTSTVNVTLDSVSAGNFSQIAYGASANLAGANLEVSVDGNLNVGDTYVIVSTTSGTLTGTFGDTGTSPNYSIVAANNPFYVFSVSYANNEVTLTVTQAPTSDVVDVQGNTVNFFTLGGIANNLTVGLVGSTYSITDSSEPITLTSAAIAAGWQYQGSTPTNTITGPTTYGSTTLSNFDFYTQDANDIVSGMTLGIANVSISGNGNGNVDFEGNVTTTGNITVSGYIAITDGEGGIAGTLTGNALSLSAPQGVGTSTLPILTVAQSDAATSSSGAVYITQTGTGSVAVSAAGAIAVVDTSGTLTVTATTTDTNYGFLGAGSGNDAVTLSSADALVLGGNLNAGGDHIVITADTDGLAQAGTPSYNQAGYSLITTCFGNSLYGLGTDAAIITVNTATAGLGDAVIGMGSIGNNSNLSEITVNSYGGNILWSNDPVYAAFTPSQTGLANGGSNTQTLKANDYLLESSGSGSVGTNARPLQLDAYASAKGLNDADMSLASGSGGVYVTEWGTDTNDAITLDSATATGAGNIRVVAANAGGHNMYVDGPVTTGSGSIAVYSDDDLILTSSLFNSGGSALIGGSGFSGTVDLEANRDLGNEEILDMMAGTAIVTSNTSANAVYLQANSAGTGTDTPGDPLIPTGGVVLTSITTGPGGGITVESNNAGGSGGSTAPYGSIAQRSGGLLDVGASGTITLIADANGTTTNAGNIGAAGAPIQVAGGTVDATTVGIPTGTAASPTGNIFINSAGSGTVSTSYPSTSFAASTTGNSAATVNLTETLGNMIISGPTNTDGGAINLTDNDTSATGGITLNAPVGDVNSGPTVITGVVNAILTTPSATYGSLASGGSAINLSAATLNVTEGPGLSTYPTGQYDILVNGTGQPIAAPFSNYAQGSTVTVGSDNYTLTYLGGASGHDVVLTFLGPVITTEPTNQTVSSGATATFAAVATGATSVNWYVNTGSGFNFSSPVGTSPTLTLTNVSTAMSGDQYEAVFANSNGSAMTSVVTLTVTSNPVPSLTSISPTSATVGDPNTTITANGSNFVSGSTIDFNGTPLTTSFVNSGQETAVIPASDLTTAGTASITVVNPAPGGGSSNAATFTVNNPAPTLTSISPTSATVGAAATTINLVGTNFVASSTVDFNGTPITTTYTSSTALSATIPASDLATAGTDAITVVNAGPGGGTSSAATFTVNNPAPTLTSISPTSATVGAAATTINLVGTNFVASSTVDFNGTPITTTYTSSTALSATIPASDLVTAGTDAITVVNAGPGGGTSSAATFTVNNPAPTLTSISPTSATVGAAATTINLVGTNFVASSTVDFNGTPITTTYTSSTALSATIPASDLATAGTDAITVVNAGPGGGTSSAATFTVNSSTTFQFDSSTTTINTVSDPGRVTLLIDRTGNTSAAQTVGFYTANGTAVAGTNYTGVGSVSSPFTVSFPANATQESVTVPITLFTGTPYSGSLSFTGNLENLSTGSTLGTPTTATVSISDPQLAVTSVTDTPTGFVLNFNRQFQPAPVHLYVSPDTTAQSTNTPASLTLYTTGSTPTLVYGTLVFSPTAPTSATFLATNVDSGTDPGAPTITTLTPGASYSLSLVGGSTAFVGTDGRALTGMGTTSPITVTTPAADTFTLSVPDFARGPGQTALTVPQNNTTPGIPVYVAGAGTITTMTVTLTYNPATLTVPSGAAVLSSAFTTAGFSITNAVYNSSGSITLTIGGGSIAASATAQTPVFYLQGTSVPSGSDLALKGVLDLSASTVNGAAVTANDGVDVDAYLGQVTGSGASDFSSLDATEVKRVEAGFNDGPSLQSAGKYDGFADAPSGSPATSTSFANTDPDLLANFEQQTGFLTSLDDTIISKAAAGTIAPEIGSEPVGTGAAQLGGIDPYVYLEPMASPPLSAPGQTGTGTAGPGTPITYAVHIDNTSSSTIGFDAGGFAVQFNANLFQISNPQSSSSLPSGFSESDNGQSTYDATGELHLTLSTSGANDNIAAGTDQIVATFVVTPDANTPAATYAQAIRIINNDGNFPTQVYNGTQLTTLSPAPVNNTPNAQIDSTIIVSSVSGAIKLSQQTTTAAIGGSFNLAVDYTNGPSQINLDAAGIAIAFNPQYLQVTSDSTSLSGGLSLTDNGASTYNTSGELHLSLSTAANGETINANTLVDLVDLTFQVQPGAPSPQDITVQVNDGTFPTQVYNNSNLVPLSTPDSNTFDPTSGTAVSIVINPDAPPQDALPTTFSQVLFNPGTAAGYHTAAANKETFTGANAIAVSDPNVTAGYAETDTTTVSITGDTTQTLAPGFLGLTSLSSVPSDVTVSGNGTGTDNLTGATSITLTSGSPTDITTALGQLYYQPGAGYYGSTTLTVSTANSGNPNLYGPTGYNSGFTDTKTRIIPVVGLFISEINLDRNTTTAVSNTQYVELYSTVPNYVIPTSVYVFGINGDKNSSGPAVGAVEDILKLGGFETGSNGYLTLAESGQPYVNASSVPVVAAGTFSANQGSGTNAGFGNNGSYNSGPNGNTLTVVHYTASGTTRTGRTPTEYVLDLEQGSASYLLVETTATSPTISASTIGASIDNNSTSSATIAGGSLYNSLNVMDGVGILRDAAGSGGADRSYAPITFVPSLNTTGTVISGSVKVTNVTLASGGAGGTIGFSPNYVGRIGMSSTATASAWLASLVTGSSGNLSLGAGANTTTEEFSGQSLDNISGPNYWAPNMTVLVNDGSTVTVNGQNYVQHSMVDELTLNFNEPVNIANLSSDFVVKDASGNPIATTATITATQTGDGLSSDVTQVTLTFNSDTSADTYAFTAADPYGNTRGLVDGNYFLDTVVGDITNNGVKLDGAHNGIPGSTTTGSGNLNGNGVNEVDEFWRLFGDLQGNRNVDAIDAHYFGAANYSTIADSADQVMSATESGNTVTVVVTNGTVFAVGQRVAIGGVTISGNATNGYNGTFIVTGVGTDPTTGLPTFTYTASVSGLAPSDANTGNIGTPTYEWYFDYDQAGDIDVSSMDSSTHFFNNHYGINGGTDYLAP